MPDIKPTAYEFGVYRLDPIKRLLFKERDPVPLQPKTLEILLALVEKHGELVEKEQLINRVWPDSFVEEGNLTVNISILRKVFGETPNEHRYIATIPGRGYSFVAAVNSPKQQTPALLVEERTQSVITIEEPEPAAVPQLLNPDVTERASATARPFWSRFLRRPKSLMVMAMSLIVAVVVFVSLNRWGWPRSRQPDWRGSLIAETVRRAKGDPKESINGARFSPDAQLFAYSAVGADNGLNLWVQQIDGGEGFPITAGPWSDRSPLWSPDGHQIAFISDRNDQIGIWIVASLGHQQPKLLATISPDNNVGGDTGLILWSTKRPVIYYCWKRNVYEVDLNSRQSRKITDFDETIPYDPSISMSPDEQSIAYVRRKDRLVSNIWSSSIDGKSPVQVTQEDGLAKSPIWHPDGQRIVYSFIKDDRFVLKVAYLDGRLPEVITLTNEMGFVWDISSDGTKLLYHGMRDESGLYKVDVATGEESQLGEEGPVRFWPRISPDGGQLSFQKNRGESFSWDPWHSSLMVSAEGSVREPRELARDALAGRWSPDGKSIGFLRRGVSSTDLYITGASGGGEKQLASGVRFTGFTLGPPFNLGCTSVLSWSPDSSKIAFGSLVHGTPNLSVVSVDGSGPHQISDNIDPHTMFEHMLWSSDGKRLAYVTEDMPVDEDPKRPCQLWVTDLHGLAPMYSTRSLIRLLGWVPSDGSFLLAEVEYSGNNRAFPADVTLVRLSGDGKVRRVIGHIPHAYFANIHLSPDRRNVAVESSDKGTDDIWLIPVAGGPPRKVTANKESRTYYSGLAWSPDSKSIYCAKQSTYDSFIVYKNFK